MVHDPASVAARRLARRLPRHAALIARGVDAITRWLCAWLLCALACAAAPAWAEPGVLALGAGERYQLSPAFLYLQDRDGLMTLDDILQPSSQAAFRPVPPGGDGPNFGFTRAAVWLRITLRVPRDAAADWLLELSYAPLDHVEVYTRHDAFDYQRQVGGDLEPFRARVLPHRNHVFPVRLTPGADSVVYLRLRSEGTVTAPVTLWQPRTLWVHDQAEYGVLSLYFGLLLGLLFYNLLLFVSVRDTGYLIYVGFVAAMALGQLALTGIGAQFLWPDWVWWNNVLPAVAFSFAAVFGLQFARNFLASPMRLPLLDRALVWQLAGWVAAIVVGLVAPYGITAWVVTCMAVGGVICMAAIGVISVRRRFAGARLFFTAWAVLLAGVFTLALHNAGWLPSSWLVVHSLLIGSALEMVLLSFALADRINVARRFKLKAHERLAAEHALVGALRQAQERLSDVLREREAMLHSLTTGVVLTLGGRIEWVNRSFAQMVGYPADELPGCSAQRLEADPDEWPAFRERVRAALQAENAFRCEHHLRRADGAVVRLAMNGTCLREREPDSGVLWTFVELEAEAGAEVSAPLPAADQALPG